jgi:hypothetical protein
MCWWLFCLVFSLISIWISLRSTFVSGKKDEAQKKQYEEAKRKKEYSKFLEKEGYKPLNFDDFRQDEDEEDEEDDDVRGGGGAKKQAMGGKSGGKQNKGKEDMMDEDSAESGSGDDDDDDDDDDDSEDDSISDGSFEFSDEEVGDGDIVFKDSGVQKVWGGSGKAAAAQTKGAGGKGVGGGQDSGKGEKKKKGKAGAGGVVKGGADMFDVPGWGEEEGGGKKKAGGNKHMTHKPNPFGKAASMAEAKKKEQAAERARLLEEHNKAKEGREAYFKGRKKERAVHMKKTKSGQPVLSNMIGRMLAKLEKD